MSCPKCGSVATVKRKGTQYYGCGSSTWDDNYFPGRLCLSRQINRVEAELRCWQRAWEIFAAYPDDIEGVYIGLCPLRLWQQEVRFALAYAIAEAEARGEVVLEGTDD
jgi:hypothetical protein